MEVSADMMRHVVQQVRDAGVKKNGDYVFNGKGENLVLIEGSKLSIESCTSGVPVIAKIKTVKICNDFYGITDPITDESLMGRNVYFEMVHLILRCNDQEGFIDDGSGSGDLIEYLNNYAEKNKFEF